MNIVIAGGTGFLGSALTTALLDEGHSVTLLTRQSPGAEKARDRLRYVQWLPDGAAGVWKTVITDANVLVNLAGESIAARRWTANQKEKILQSRVLATRSLVQAINLSPASPRVFVSGSAVGYYGPRSDEVITEEQKPGSDFLASVCRQWEIEAERAASTHTRVVCLRTGLVLDRRGGALPKMLPPFWFGAGGPVGSGRQYWPWIHLQDWVDLVRFVIRTPTATGPINVTAPNPLPNAEFARALGRTLHRPALLPTPGFALKLLLGEMADGLLLSGQRAVPGKAERLGHTFSFRDLEPALHTIFSR